MSVGALCTSQGSILELDASWKEETHQLVEESAKETVQESSKIQKVCKHSPRLSTKETLTYNHAIMIQVVTVL